MRIKTIEKYWVSGIFPSKQVTLNCTISAFNGTLVQKFQKETRFKQWCPISLGDVHAHCFLYCSHLFFGQCMLFGGSIGFIFFFSLQFSVLQVSSKVVHSREVWLRKFNSNQPIFHMSQKCECNYCCHWTFCCHWNFCCHWKLCCH